MASVSEDVKQAHPFTSKDQIPQLVGQSVAFVGKVDRVEDSTLYMKTADGK